MECMNIVLFPINLVASYTLMMVVIKQMLTRRSSCLWFSSLLHLHPGCSYLLCAEASITHSHGVNGMSHSGARWDIRLWLSFQEGVAGSCLGYNLCVGAHSTILFSREGRELQHIGRRSQVESWGWSESAQGTDVAPGLGGSRMLRALIVFDVVRREGRAVLSQSLQEREVNIDTCGCTSSQTTVSQHHSEKYYFILGLDKFQVISVKLSLITFFPSKISWNHICIIKHL